MPCNQNVGHLVNKSFNLLEFIIDTYFNLIEVGFGGLHS